MATDPPTDLPDQARPILAIIAESIQALQAKITALHREKACEGGSRRQAADDHP